MIPRIRVGAKAIIGHGGDLNEQRLGTTGEKVKGRLNVVLDPLARAPDVLVYNTGLWIFLLPSEQNTLNVYVPSMAKPLFPNAMFLWE